MNTTTENRNDFCTLVLTELKALGVKVPKAKKLKQKKNVTVSAARIFGAVLYDQEFVSESGSFIPKFIAEATSFLRRYSEVTVGLFRKVGSIARQRDLRDKLERGESLEGSEPNDVASLLKQWLRELPEPLIPAYLYDLLIKCFNLETLEKRTSATLLSCLLLRPENLNTLKHLLQFLADIAANSDKNMMDLHNLAVIMAPNLFAAENSGLDNLNGKLLQVHTSLIELLIEICPQFGEIPQSISSQLDENISLDNLDFSIEAYLSPSKSKKKLKSASVQDILCGIRKLVGQPCTPVPDSHMLNPHSSLRSASKRKADRDLCLLSPAKKQALTPFSFDDVEQNIAATPGKGVTGRKHSRVRSFNLLKKKERKSHRTPNSKSINKMPSPKTQTPVVNTRIEKTEKLQNNFLKVELPSKRSSSVSQEMQYLSVPSLGMKKSTSDCIISSSLHEFRDVKKIAPSASQGNLPNKSKRSSPYNPSPTIPKRCKGDFRFSSTKIKKSKLEEKSVDDCLDSLETIKSSKESLIMRKSSAMDANTVTDDVFVAGSPRRASSRRKLKMNKPQVTQNVDKKCGTRVETILQNPKNISDVNLTSPQVGNPPLNGIPKLNASIRKNKIESLRQEPALTRRNSSRRRKREVTHVKSLDSGTANQFKRSAITNRSLKIEKNGDVGFQKLKVEAEKKLHAEDSQFTPQKNSLLRRETKSSLRRGRPNTIKSGLPSELCPRYNNTTIKPDSTNEEKANIDNTKNDNSSEDMGTNSNNLESLFDAKTLLDDICDTLNISIINENVKDLNLPEESEIQKNKSDNVCVVPTRYFTRNQAKRNSFSHLEMHLGNTQVNLKTNEKVAQKLSSSDSKIHFARKCSKEFKRSHNSVVIKDESKIKEKEKKWRYNSFDDLNIKPLPKTDNNKIELNFVLNDGECNNGDQLIDENTTTLSCNHGDSKSRSSSNENPSNWVSGETFFNSNTLDANDNANKRESIVQILKNNSGNVLAKVHQYDYVSKPNVFKTPELPFERGQSSSLKRFKTPISVNMSSSRRTSSVKQFKTPNSGTAISLRKETRCRRLLAIPPPKFVIPDSSPAISDVDYPLPKELTNTISVEDGSQVLNQSPSSVAHNTPPQDFTTSRDASTVSHPLKELTNISLVRDNFKTPTQASPASIYSTPTNNQENTPMKTSLGNSKETKKNSSRIKPKRNSYSGHTPFKLRVQFSRSESSPMLDKKYV